MSHTVNPLVLRLGHKLSWTFLHNYIYISKTFRFTLLINVVLLGFLNKYNYTLVKYFVNLETTKWKILVVALRNFNINRKPSSFAFYNLSRAYRIFFFNLRKFKKKNYSFIKHHRLKKLLKKIDLGLFVKAKKILKKHNKYSKKKITLYYKNFKQFHFKRTYTYFYKNFAKYRLNNLFNSYNNFSILKSFFNNKSTSVNGGLNILNLYNLYNFYYLWFTNIISNLSSMRFLKSFDRKGFSPFWMKRYKFLKYFGSKSKLLFFNFIGKNINNKKTTDLNLFKNNISLNLFSCFLNRFLKFKYIMLNNINFFNYKIINKIYYFFLKLKFIFKFFIYYFTNINDKKINKKKNSLLLFFLNFNKLIYIFNKNYFFFNKNSFFKYYFNNLKYILKCNKTKFTTNNNKKLNFLSNVFNTINFKKKVAFKFKNNFYKTITYYNDAYEYNKWYFRQLRFRFIKNLRLDSHLFGKYNFPFSKQDTLLYRIIHDTMLRDAYLNSKSKGDSLNKEIKFYNLKKRRFPYLKFKKKMFKINKFNILFSLKKKKINLFFFMKKIKKRFNSLNKFVKPKFNNFNKYLDLHDHDFFVKNFCSFFINNIFLKLNKKIKFVDFFFNNNSTAENSFSDDDNSDCTEFTNNFFLLFNSFANNSKKLLFLVRSIFLKHSFIKNNIFLNFFSNFSKNNNFGSVNYNLLYNIKLNLLTLFYFDNYYSVNSINLFKFHYFNDSNKFINNFNLNILFSHKNYNLLLNLFNFFNFKNFNLTSFFYRINEFKAKRHITYSLYINWLKNKKFFFFLEKEFEKIFKVNTNIYIINPISRFLLKDSGLGFIQSIPFVINKVYMHPKERKNMIYFLVIFFLSLKLRASYLLSKYLTITIEKREKHFEFFTVLKRVMSVLSISEFNLSGLTIGLYGKVNGKDRAYRYFIHKFIKPSVRKQCMILNSELSHCYSRYGVFGVRIWMHEF